MQNLTINIQNFDNYDIDHQKKEEAKLTGMSNKYSNSHKEKDRDDDSVFSSDLSLLTYEQRDLIESIRRDYLPQVLKDQGLLNDEEFTRRVKGLVDEKK